MTTTANYPDVRTSVEFPRQPEEYQSAVKKLVVSHTVNELYGAQVFDEPAIALAPTPYAKWLACRVAMEEYHHHVRFKALADEIGVPPEAHDPARKRPLSIFEFPLRTWAEFCVIKLLADYAELLLVEDLLHCSFHPLRNLARITMPEERFHAQFGRDFCGELIKTDAGRGEVQDAINRYYPGLPKFFGATASKNNESFRRFGLKSRTNEAMRADFIERAQRLVVGEMGLSLPSLEIAA